MENANWIQYVKKNLSIVFLVFVGTWGGLTASMKTPSFMEIDSYVMPIVSLQHRGSIIIEPQDIEQAKIDFPSLYQNVNTFEDFRSCKLNKIDESHWIAYYFPVYAVVCLPMKLLLTLFKLNQEQCFTLTNMLFFWCALCCIIKHYSKEKKEGLGCAVLMCCCPIYYYLQYIGAEPLMFSLAIFSYLLWKNKKYKRAALLISVTSMMNPTFMGIGIVLFVEYIYNTCVLEKKSVLNKNEFKKIIFLCMCYIPSLVPFIFNKIAIGEWNPTMRTALNNLGDTLSQRFLAYLFDINLGIASISVVIVVLFLIAIIYSIIKRNSSMIFEWASVLLVIGCFSIMNHINCGMLVCARYVIWIYPGVVFVICDFVYKVFDKQYRKSLVVLSICSLSCIVVGKYNGLYPYVDFNNVSKFVLDHVPSAYISMCDSTFNSRANHIDGGYDTSGITMYTDSVTGEVRKIMFYNTEENRRALHYMLVSDQDQDMVHLDNKMEGKKIDKVCYINNGRNANVQYKQKYSQILYSWVSNYIDAYGKDTDTLLKTKVSAGMTERDKESYQVLYDCIPLKSLSEKEYIHWLYVNILNREETEVENQGWIDAGLDEYQIFIKFIESDEFKLKCGLIY